MDNLALQVLSVTSLWLAITGWIANDRVVAQIVPDNTLPINSRVTSNGNTFIIDSGTVAGDNLFHSFAEFSIRTGTAGFFNNATNITNIISRVTGSSISNINGAIAANGSANLFLINPNGIVFGPNAQLNLGGSFIASTAKGIQLADGSIFSATNPIAPPLLTVNVPIGLQFGLNSAPIINQSVAGSLLTGNPRVGLETPGKTLVLAGGDLLFQGGNLTAFQGQVELGSLRSSGLVSLTPTATGLALGYQGIENFGTIELTGGAAVNASGLGGGAIRVRGGQVTLTEGSRLVAETFGNLNGRGIDIEAHQFKLQQGAFVSTSTFSSGVAGNINIRADRVEMTGTSPLETAGQLLTATFNPFNVSNGLFSLSLGSGASGNITIDTGQLIAQNGANVLTTTFINGAGGNLTLIVSELAEISNGSLLYTGTAGSANSGNLAIATNQLQVLNGTLIGTNPGSTSTGSGGNFTITANSVELRGTPAGAPLPNGLFTTTIGAGDAGDLTLVTSQLILADGSQISASSAAITARQLLVRDGAQISAATGSAGSAGNLNIKASEFLEVRGFATEVTPTVESVSFGVIGDGILPSAIEANTSGPGEAGDLRIETGRLIVREGAEIGVRGTASGAAGNLEVKANSIELDNQGALSAATLAGAGGNIRLEASNIILRHNSQITTNTGNTNGGNISIDTENLVAVPEEDSDISANSRDSLGGNITVNATGGIFGIQFRSQKTPLSDITATGGDPALSGNVTLNTPGVDPSSGLVKLPDTFTESSDRIIVGCAAAQGNSFTVTGRGGLPEDPTATIRGQTVWQDLQDFSSDSEGVNATFENTQGLSIDPQGDQTTRQSSAIVEATGWVMDEQGNITLVAALPKGATSAYPSKPPDCQQLSDRT
ncbi:MAG TPA: filamentous hemagglutinin [Cyanobacteria bacterium UBA8803]|nr:filamentous hemagglutinin [Cyanobacteria bacterium UBA9273]HBL61675.1 filamentous hemagglutinin [Cyanobacteria bacterium UBA8803]